MALDSDFNDNNKPKDFFFLNFVFNIISYILFPPLIRWRIRREMGGNTRHEYMTSEHYVFFVQGLRV